MAICFQILRFAPTASEIGTRLTKRRCARTRGAATRSTNHCRIDRARRQRRRECLDSESSGVANVTSRFETNSGSFPRPLLRQRSRTSPRVHNLPSCNHELDFAATRTRVCELIVKLHWRNIPNKPAKSTWKKERTMSGLAHGRTVCIWHVRHTLHERLKEKGEQMVDDGSERGWYLDGPCDNRG